MALPIEKLLMLNENRYEMCVAAIKIAQRVAATWSPEDIALENEKLAVLAIEKLLAGEIPISKRMHTAEALAAAAALEQ